MNNFRLTITSGDDIYNSHTCGDIAYWAEYDYVNEFLIKEDYTGDILGVDDEAVIDCLEPDNEYCIDLYFVKEVYELVNGHNDWAINPETGESVLERLKVLLHSLDQLAGKEYWGSKFLDETASENVMRELGWIK